MSSSDLPGKSYTVVTLRKLSERYAARLQLFFVVGMDAFLEMDTWWHFHELFELAHMVVLRRPGYNESEMARISYGNGFPLFIPIGTDEACYQASSAHASALPEQHLAGYFVNPNSTTGERRKIRPLSGSPRSGMHYIHANRLYRGEDFLEAEAAQLWNSWSRYRVTEYGRQTEDTKREAAHEHQRQSPALRSRGVPVQST